MIWSPLKSRGPALLARILLAGVFVAFMSGCAWLTTKVEADPEADEQPDQTNSQEIQKRPHESIADLLNARAAGVIVTENADHSLSIRIRGTSSVYSSNEPLYVVDGVPVRVGPGGTIAGINPYEIASIQVLKGPPETSIYGLRGANGVILIKTKR